MDNPEQNLNLKTKRSKKRKIVLIVLALLIIAGASYGSWRLIIKPRLNPAADWQIYKSQEFGYQIKYPPNYRFEKTKRTEMDWKYAPFFAEISKEDIEIARNDRKITLILSLYNNPLKLSPREWINWANDNDARLLGVEAESNEEKQSRAEVFNDIIINGISAIRLDAEFPDRITATIYLSKEDKLFYILYINHLKDSGNNNEKILQVFLDNLKIE